ncbi:MAG: hypothetical protein K9G76_11905 [Bacteroidales bacterium]|nr:hypothetical protein [Bacteroidales bacterium]MCF8405147.1 hypothetical protein [Bacteroidales bacterium]
MHKNPHFLIISGTGRNTGKTTVACKLIQHFSRAENIIGIKISPHFHQQGDHSQLIFKGEDYTIYQENSAKKSKDTSRMLKAGACKVIYIEVRDYKLEEAYQHLLKYIPNDTCIICESPALRSLLQPGIFIIVDNPDQTNKKPEVIKQVKMADFFFKNGAEGLEKIIGKIKPTSKGWMCA